MPCKIVKIKKYKHKQEKWITCAILRSIKYKDKLYKKLWTTDIDSTMYATRKHDFITYNNILKKCIQWYKTCKKTQ